MVYRFFNQFRNKFEIYIIDIIEYWVVILQNFLHNNLFCSSSPCIYAIPIASLSCKIYLKIWWRLYQQNNNIIWFIYLFKQQSIQAYYIVYYLSRAPCRKSQEVKNPARMIKFPPYQKKQNINHCTRKKKQQTFSQNLENQMIFFSYKNLSFVYIGIIYHWFKNNLYHLWPFAHLSKLFNQF